MLEILVMATDANDCMGIRPRDSEATSRVVGQHGNPYTNWAGEQLRDFCAENELCSASTFFIKPRYNTWKNPRNCRGYQLDHFLVSQKDLNRFEMRSSVESTHLLCTVTISPCICACI